MLRYEAPKPYKESFFSFLNYLSKSPSIGKLILPAQWREPCNLTESASKQFAAQYDITIKGGYVGTYDGAVLDTIQLTPNAECKKDFATQHFIIKFNGNGMLYQDALRDFAYDANTLNITVIGFNYRGVGNSKKRPTTFQNLVTDGIAQVQRLLDSGVDSKKITVDGLSLGGGVATMVASHFHQINKPIYVWNDRSFASISKAAAGMVAPESKSIFGDALETSLESTSFSVMKLTGWEANIGEAYKAIPETYKGYMYVGKKSKHSNGDGVISHSASLHKSVKLDEKKKCITTGHKVYAKSGLFGGGHNMTRSALMSAENIYLTGQDQFEKFITKHKI